MALINVNLKPYNTFGLEAIALKFEEINNVNDLDKAFRNINKPFLILGGGSNMLLKNDVGHVIKNNIKGISRCKEDKDSTIVEFGGGEEWHDCVLWALDNNLGGIENLSLIPGTIGAAPIQNIGAYGVELKDVFYKLEAFNLETLQFETFYKADCHFGYRSSIFKGELKDKYFISKVFLKFDKEKSVNISYGAISDKLKELEIFNPTTKDISNVIITIRQSKLPDPKDLGNSGSFFQNPIIDQKAFDELLSNFPDAKYYSLEDGLYKIPAAWLIEQCGWKGKVVGNVGCYKNQPLVLVNHGGATGQELWNHAINVKQSVFEKYGISINPEVNII